jgi:hypothetical protein
MLLPETVEPQPKTGNVWTRLVMIELEASGSDTVRPRTRAAGTGRLIVGRLGGREHGASENQILAWRSLPDSDIVTAGSVNFDTVRGGRSTQVTVHLQYAPPAGKAGALIASIFGREPSQTIREDLRHRDCSGSPVFESVFSSNVFNRHWRN